MPTAYDGPFPKIVRRHRPGQYVRGRALLRLHRAGSSYLTPRRQSGLAGCNDGSTLPLWRYGGVGNADIIRLCLPPWSACLLSTPLAGRIMSQ